MAIGPSDIDFLLSGGSTNSNPNNSIGGPPSNFPVLGLMNNLFANVKSESANSGSTDYRCFYISNRNATDTLYDVQVYFSEQGPRGSNVSVGVQKRTEIQKVSLISPISSGVLNMRYDKQQFSVTWGGSPESFGASLQSNLSAIVSGVSVLTQVQGENYFFTVSFLNKADNKSHPLLEVIRNNLVGRDVPIVSISKIVEGRPINSIATSISVDTVPPVGVSFYTPDSSSKLTVGSLSPGDIVPIWLKRITLPGTEYLQNDYFKLKVVGRPF
jgi:hypothetical protein